MILIRYICIIIQKLSIFENCLINVYFQHRHTKANKATNSQA